MDGVNGVLRNWTSYGAMKIHENSISMLIAYEQWIQLRRKDSYGFLYIVFPIIKVRHGPFGILWSRNIALENLHVLVGFTMYKQSVFHGNLIIN